MTRFQKIDEDGYLINDEGLRLDDEAFGFEFLNSLSLTDGFQTRSNYKNLDIVVEAFNAPLVIRHLSFDGRKLLLKAPYGFEAPADLSTLSIDSWDRFHGLTQKGLPFVFSRQAQVEFFDLLESFDDDSVTIGGHRILTPDYYIAKKEVRGANFWSDIYRTEEPGWDLNEPAPFLKDVLPQLKLNRQRVLVLGCGKGHDAAFLAQQGHIVTAIDFSSEAINGAHEKYGHISGLEFLQADVFQLPQNQFGPFDLIVEHTCFCAVDPQLRNDLVQVWKKQLVEGGHFLGAFYVMSKRVGPPYGGSEWEIRERLKSHFDFRFWTRWRHSLPRRLGKELVVYAQKK